MSASAPTVKRPRAEPPKQVTVWFADASLQDKAALLSSSHTHFGNDWLSSFARNEQAEAPYHFLSISANPDDSNAWIRFDMKASDFVEKHKNDREHPLFYHRTRKNPSVAEENDVKGFVSNAEYVLLRVYHVDGANTKLHREYFVHARGLVEKHVGLLSDVLHRCATHKWHGIEMPMARAIAAAFPLTGTNTGGVTAVYGPSHLGYGNVYVIDAFVPEV
jgi:hypothetical protein